MGWQKRNRSSGGKGPVWRECVKSQSLLAMRSPTFKMHVWFNVTRLIITPAVVCGILIGLDCGTSLFDTIPHLAKLVIIVNSSVPPAMLVILSLKSEGMSESAAVVSKCCSRLRTFCQSFQLLGGQQWD